MVARKLDFLHFLGKKDGTGKAKMLCFDAAKVFCGSCVQLCFQIVLLEYSFIRNPSQLLSIISSCLVIIKTSFEIITYQRDVNTASEENESRQNEDNINNEEIK